MSSEPQRSNAEAYDAVPYRDFPYSFSHVRHLETMAVLFGMQPPPIDNCRVLELGCAGGGNIIPQAFDLPGSRFVAADYSPRQIEEARKSADSLGLKNLELRCANIMDIDDSWGTFDYIISHGVFSWVPRPVQDKLLELSARNLSDHGVAFVSYNTYPGWHLANIARELMCYHASHFDTPQAKIAQAMSVLQFVCELTTGQSAMGMFLKDELAMLRQLDNDSYLFHDHLEDHNIPIYFHEFIGRAAAHGLQYLAETDFHLMLLQNLPGKAREALGKLPVVQQEQYMDFVRGRRFRKTLLCHEGMPLQRMITPERIKRFHFTVPPSLEVANVDIRDDSKAEFRTDGAKLESSDRLVKAAMMRLKEICPRYVSFQELYLTALARLRATQPGIAGAPQAERLAEALLTAFSVNVAQICLHPPRWAGEVRGRPVVSALARCQANRGTFVTNLRHQAIKIGPLEQGIIHRLDGDHDRAALASELQARVAAGEITVKHGDQVVKNPDPRLLAEVVDQTLQFMSNHALLVG